MTTLYLIRHAQAEGNLYRIAQGQYNSILTDRGNRQVQALERRFADVPIDAVYSSDLYRTCATASAICRPKHLPLHRRRDLREICVGTWEQKTWGEIARTDPQKFEDFSYHLERWFVDGAETPEQVRDRILTAVREIVQENPNRTVAVFSHGYAIRILLATLEGRSIAEVGETPHGDNTAVSLLEADGDTLRIVFRDDNSHLRNPQYTGGEDLTKRTGALTPGLYFEPIHLPEQTAFLNRLASGAPVELASQRPTLVGYLLEETQPAGVVQFVPELDGDAGWISLLCVDPSQRGKRLGVQLLGQAVAYFREKQAQVLRLSLPKGCPEQGYFEKYGFAPIGEADGRTVLEKSIRYLPEFLEEASN